VRIEAEQDQLYTTWEDALARAPLLRQLCLAVEHFVESWLEVSDGRLRDPGIGRMQRFLEEIPQCANDDIPIDILRKVVHDPSHYDSYMR
jgi:hypothetical protein